MDWFSIETKVRKLVSELVEPTIRRGMEEREQFTKLQSTLDSTKYKVDELQYSFTKYQQKMATLEEAVFEKLAQFKLDRERDDQEIRNDMFQMDFKIDSISSEMEMVREQERGVQKQVNINKQEFSKLQEMIAKHRENTTECTLGLSDKIEALSLDLENSRRDSYQTTNSNSQIVTSLKDAITKQEITISIIKSRLDEFPADCVDQMSKQNSEMSQIKDRIYKKFDFINYDLSHHVETMKANLEEGLKKISLDSYFQITRLLYASLDEMAQHRLAGCDKDELEHLAIKYGADETRISEAKRRAETIAGSPSPTSRRKKNIIVKKVTRDSHKENIRLEEVKTPDL